MSFAWSRHTAAGGRPLALAAIAATVLSLAPARAEPVGGVAMPRPTPVAVRPAALPVAPAGAPAKPVACRIPTELARIGTSLVHTAERLAAGAPLVVVAVGSSSTAGAGASSRAASYPSRLAVELERRFAGHAVTIHNHGVNGDDTAMMLRRFDAVVARHPDLVLWQVGTNAVLRNRPLARARALIGEGLARLKASGADVVLIDPQYAPKVLKRRDAPAMVRLIADEAGRAKVGLFHRFALMQHWREIEGLHNAVFLSPDELHMNDWSYACLARVLGAAIDAAVDRPSASVDVMPASLPMVP